MAWTYANWRSQATDALRLSTLRSHMDEVGAAISASVSDGGASRDSATLQAYLDMLGREEDKLIARINGASGRHGYIRFGRV